MEISSKIYSPAGQFDRVYILVVLIHTTIHWSCYLWFFIRYMSVCFHLDIDECSLNNGGCAQTCLNTRGSFTCKCNKGYQVGNTDKNTCDGKGDAYLIWKRNSFIKEWMTRSVWIISVMKFDIDRTPFIIYWKPPLVLIPESSFSKWLTKFGRNINLCYNNDSWNSCHSFLDETSKYVILDPSLVTLYARRRVMVSFYSFKHLCCYRPWKTIPKLSNHIFIDVQYQKLFSRHRRMLFEQRRVCTHMFEYKRFFHLQM